ncbi:hypothetical protein [Pandoraea sp. ISTKB]|uniref:hypothetical protein n=1 Tax=Pandoraea sp. ISTKB TaxID=1586708 RepID=UPI000A8B06C0|nr:hypothetical protein [Pandoraea sp. ISTKB]
MSLPHDVCRLSRTRRYSVPEKSERTAHAFAFALTGARSRAVHEARAPEVDISRQVAQPAPVPPNARYYCLTPDEAAQIPRQPIAPPRPKRYLGFDRVAQSLRHIAIAVNMTMRERLHVDPLEVQVSVFGGRLHIASNFHADRICDALHLALTDDALMSGAPRRVAPGDERNWLAMVMSRRVRDIAKLRHRYVQGQGFDRMRAAARAEVKQGTGLPADGTTGLHSALRQLDDAFATLRNVLRDAASESPQFAEVVVHTPMRDTPKLPALPTGVTETMHAEQCIESAIAENAERWHRDAVTRLHLCPDALIVVPMAGRFVPCAACAEVEAESRTQGGLFDPANARFVLHRSSRRIGMAFANEVQHIAQATLAGTPAEAAQRAKTIAERFVHAPHLLRAYGTPVVLDYSLDTESESSGDESQG